MGIEGDVAIEVGDMLRYFTTCTETAQLLHRKPFGLCGILKVSPLNTVEKSLFETVWKTNAVHYADEVDVVKRRTPRSLTMLAVGIE